MVCKMQSYFLLPRHRWNALTYSTAFRVYVILYARFILGTYVIVNHRCLCLNRPSTCHLESWLWTSTLTKGLYGLWRCGQTERVSWLVPLINMFGFGISRSVSEWLLSDWLNGWRCLKVLTWWNVIDAWCTAMQVSEGRLGLSLSKELLMSHDVLCVKYRLNLVHISCQVSVRAVRHLLIRCFLSCFDSPTKDPNKLLIAAGLLDHTIKVFFDDSLKFFLSLYGLLCFAKIFLF